MKNKCLGTTSDLLNQNLCGMNTGYKWRDTSVFGENVKHGGIFWIFMLKSIQGPNTSEASPMYYTRPI